MQRIAALPIDTTDTDAAALFSAIKQQIGSVPNIFRTMAHSPSTLEAYLGFSGALGKGRLSTAERELVALAAAGANACDYCASAHTALGGMAGLDRDTMSAALSGVLAGDRAGALVAFVRQLVEQNGMLEDRSIAALKGAGFDDGELIEIIANTAANIFTNYFNHIADTEIDFPVVLTGDAVAA